MQTLLLALCLLANAGATLADVDLQLPANGEVYELSEFRGSNDRRYFGAYSSPYALTGGTALHLFPDGRFTIVEFMDIAPDEVLASGTYRVDGTSLVLSFSHIKPKHDSVRTQFADLHILWGWIDKGDYVTGFEVFIFPKGDWEELHEGAADIEYMQRHTAYPDWQRIVSEYEAQWR